MSGRGLVAGEGGCSQFNFIYRLELCPTSTSGAWLYQCVGVISPVCSIHFPRSYFVSVVKQPKLVLKPRS